MMRQNADAGVGEIGVEQKRPLVLVIDDEGAIRAVASRALALFEMDSVVAADGEEGCTIFTERRDEIQCVLLDMSMPRLDGVETLTRLRQIDPVVKVVLMTGYPLVEAESRFGQIGLSGFLQKPFELSDLRNVLESVLRS